MSVEMNKNDDRHGSAAFHYCYNELMYSSNQYRKLIRPFVLFKNTEYRTGSLLYNVLAIIAKKVSTQQDEATNANNENSEFDDIRKEFCLNFNQACKSLNIDYMFRKITFLYYSIRLKACECCKEQARAKIFVVFQDGLTLITARGCFRTTSTQYEAAIKIKLGRNHFKFEEVEIFFRDSNWKNHRKDIAMLSENLVKPNNISKIYSRRC